MSWPDSCASAERRRPRASLVAAAAGVAALLVGGCRPAPDSYERLIPVFGTLVRVEIVGTDARSAEEAFVALEQLYTELDTDWRSFGDGELGRVNAELEAGRRVTLSPRLAALVARSLEIRAASDGLFDPRVGALVALWGFDDLAARDPPPPPADAVVATARSAALDAAGLHLDGTQLRSDGPVRLELAGIAKGSALAAGAKLLSGRGIDAALIVAGGDVVALGEHGGRAWRVGVRDPLHEGILGTVDLASGEAALSSGIYERGYTAGGKRLHHIIDPRTGRPAEGAAGTTVLHTDPELGNAAAMALLVGGPARFTELTQRLGVACALLVATDGRTLTTPCMRQRLTPP